MGTNYFATALKLKTYSGGTKGVWGIAPLLGSCTPTGPSMLEEHNGKNQPFLANLGIFTPSETHFAPLNASHNKNF